MPLHYVPNMTLHYVHCMFTLCVANGCVIVDCWALGAAAIIVSGCCDHSQGHSSRVGALSEVNRAGQRVRQGVLRSVNTHDSIWNRHRIGGRNPSHTRMYGDSLSASWIPLPYSVC